MIRQKSTFRYLSDIFQMILAILKMYMMYHFQNWVPSFETWPMTKWRGIPELSYLDWGVCWSATFGLKHCSDLLKGVSKNRVSLKFHEWGVWMLFNVPLSAFGGVHWTWPNESVYSMDHLGIFFCAHESSILHRHIVRWVTGESNRLVGWSNRRQGGVWTFPPGAAKLKVSLTVPSWSVGHGDLMDGGPLWGDRWW